MLFQQESLLLQASVVAIDERNDMADFGGGRAPQAGQHGLAVGVFEKGAVGEVSKLLIKIVRQVKTQAVSKPPAEALEFSQPDGIVIGQMQQMEIW